MSSPCACSYCLGERCPSCGLSRCPLCKKSKPMTTAIGELKGCTCQFEKEFMDLLRHRLFTQEYK